MKTLLALAALGIAFTTVPALADEPRLGTATRTEFVGVDLDNGHVYYNGVNSGRYCVYKTVQVFNTVTGYVEWRRARRCGRGLYVR